MEKFQKIKNLLTKKDDEFVLLGMGLAIKETLSDTEVDNLHKFIFKNYENFSFKNNENQKNFFLQVQTFLKKYNSNAKFTSND
jgi:hypothetical protein